MKGFLGLNFDNVFEPTSKPAGEYQLRVLDASVKESTKGKGNYISAKLEILNEPTAKDINHVMMIPTANDDMKQANKRLFAIQSFIKACGADPSALQNISELTGGTVWAILIEEADPEYGMQNRIRKFVVGK
jgi:hypothetical protein